MTVLWSDLFKIALDVHNGVYVRWPQTKASNLWFELVISTICSKDPGEGSTGNPEGEKHIQK